MYTKINQVSFIIFLIKIFLSIRIIQGQTKRLRSTVGYKIKDLPGLSETEIDNNKQELLDVIRNYGPKSLLELNHTRYYRKGFIEDFDDGATSKEIEAEKKERWDNLMGFFDYPGGLEHFKYFWWPRYTRVFTKASTQTATKEFAANLWDIDEYAEQYTLPPTKFVF